QTDKSLPVTGSLDQITLDALGVASDSAGLSPSVGATSSMILTDAVNALARTADPQTGKTGVLAATNSGLYRSYDPTKGWQKLPYGAAFDSHTTTVSTDPKQPETIWVGTASSGVLVSTDGGSSWQQVDGIPTDAPVNVIAQDSQRSSHVYVGTKQ